MLLAFGERMLNEQIRSSTAARERLAELAGKRLAISVRDTDVRIVVGSTGDSMSLEVGAGPDCDVELAAGLFDLIRLARASGLSDLKSTDAALRGDIRIAEAYSELLRLAVPNAEDLLADWVGDMPAHAAGVTARGIGGWTWRAGRAFEENLAEYLQEESPNLPPPPLARQFFVEVDRIRDAVDRAEQRLVKLERQIKAY